MFADAPTTSTAAYNQVVIVVVAATVTGTAANLDPWAPRRVYEDTHASYDDDRRTWGRERYRYEDLRAAMRDVAYYVEGESRRLAVAPPLWASPRDPGAARRPGTARATRDRAAYIGRGQRAGVGWRSLRRS